DFKVGQVVDDVHHIDKPFAIIAKPKGGLRIGQQVFDQEQDQPKPHQRMKSPPNERLRDRRGCNSHKTLGKKTVFTLYGSFEKEKNRSAFSTVAPASFSTEMPIASATTCAVSGRYAGSFNFPRCFCGAR